MVYAAYVVFGAMAFLPEYASRADALQIYTWREDTARMIPEASPMIWVSIRYGADKRPIGASWQTARPAEFVARETAAALKSHPVESRAIILGDAGLAWGPHGEPELFPGGNLTIEGYARGGYVESTATWMRSFWRLLKRSRVAPSFVVLDYEGAPGFWGLRQDPPVDADARGKMPPDIAGAVFAMQLLQQRLGGSPDAHVPIDYANHSGDSWSWNRPAVIDFNRWFAPRRAAAVRAAIFQPAWDVFGGDLPASNYDDQERAWEGHDLNNWPMPSTTNSGNWSSPSTYLGAIGQRYNVWYSDRTIAFRRALRWVDCRNGVRSALARTPNVAPWYSRPDFNLAADEDVVEHRLLWAAGLLHDRALGVSVMLFWSEQAWSPEEVAFAQPIVTYLASMISQRPEKIEPISEVDSESALRPWHQLALRLENGS
jgi:hypothetical protein